LKNILIKTGVILSIGLLALSAACGGDDDDDGGDENTPAAEASTAATTAATTEVEPTEEGSDGEGGSADQPSYSEMTESQQSRVDALCGLADDPATALADPSFDPNILLQSAQAGELGLDIAEAAGPLDDALAGTDPAALDAAAADMLAVCEDIGWTAS
jgi:hypothetical protein